MANGRRKMVNKLACSTNAKPRKAGVVSHNVIETDSSEAQVSPVFTGTDTAPTDSTSETEREASVNISAFPQETTADTIKADASRQSETIADMCQDVSRFTDTSATNVDEITHDFEDLDLYSHPSMMEGERPGAMPVLCDTTPSETRRTPSSCRVDKSRRHCVVGANNITNDTTHCHYATPVSESGEYNAIWCQNEDGDTPLHVALICYDWHAVASIVSTSTPSLLDVQNNLRQTPLHLSVIVERPELVTLMLEHGACATLQDRNGDTPLHIACRRGLLDCIEAMTSTVTLPDTISDVMNYDGETIVHVAAAEGHVNTVRYLIQRPLSANVNVRDGRSGRTVLHHAVESRNMPVLMLLLLTPGVWVDAITYDGRTPLALAEGRGYGDIAELLVVAGADTACGWADSDLDDTNDDPYASADDNSADDTFFDDFCIRGRPVQSTRTTPVARTRD